jgi:hypothetical protein
MYIFYMRYKETQGTNKLKLKLNYDRRPAGLSILVSGSHLEPLTIYLLLSDNASFLMWGALLDEKMGLYLLVHLLLGLTRAITLGSKSHRNHDHVLLSHMRFPQSGGPGSRIYVPQKQGGSVGFLFVASYDSQGYGGGILIRLHTG